MLVAVLDDVGGTRTMKSRNSAIRACGGALVVALLVTSCSGGGGGSAGSSDPARKADTLATLTQGTYVALGDSYTAGPDVPTQGGTPAGCDRSSVSYPDLVAQKLGFNAAKVHDVSCSGATIADLTGKQSTSGGVNAAQLTALSSSTTLVTLGIGGNDVDFASVLTHCVEMDLIPALIGNAAAKYSPCKAYYTSDGINKIAQLIKDAAISLPRVLSEITRRAPKARVFVVGYPDLLPSSGAGCADSLGITSPDLVFLNAEEVGLNAMLKLSAKAAGAVYVNTYTPSQGKDACAAESTRWIEPLLPSSPAAPLHPNARGEQGMADAVLGSIKVAVPSQ
jgi:lysophospholipase L1-like esterase